jgi:hypothetical protein
LVAWSLMYAVYYPIVLNPLMLPVPRCSTRGEDICTRSSTKGFESENLGGAASGSTSEEPYLYLKRRGERECLHCTSPQGRRCAIA